MTEELSTITTTVTPTPTTATIITNHNRNEDRKPSGLMLPPQLKTIGPATGSNLLPVTVTCHVCGEKGHYVNQFRKTTNNNTQGRAYMLRDRNAYQDPNVVTCMFLLNQHLARVLFDSGADKSFVSISLAYMLNIPPITIDTFYNIEMADGNLVSTNTVIQGCTMTLLNQPFEIDLMPIKLGSFDVVIGMDWLSKYHARIICDKKVIHIWKQISEKRKKNQAKLDKTKHGMEKHEKTKSNQSQSSCCKRTRSQSRNLNRQQQQAPLAFVEPFDLEEPIETLAPPVVTMDDNRTMAQLLEAPTVGYEDAIVVPEITADNFELKHGLLTLVQNKQFFGHDKKDPHAYIRYFNKFTSTMKFPNIPSTSACPHHGFSELHQLDTFYNALNSNDQDSLNSAAGGNFLDKILRDCLRIIESKSKVRSSRNKPVVAKVSSSSSTPGISPNVAELKDMVKALLLDKKS
ncbi:reverse transcriptase domain-containing protein [Tanacetum coccineum]